jgi:hypothetical protein
VDLQRGLAIRTSGLSAAALMRGCGVAARLILSPAGADVRWSAEDSKVELKKILLRTVHGVSIASLGR